MKRTATLARNDSAMAFKLFPMFLCVRMCIFVSFPVKLKCVFVSSYFNRCCSSCVCVCVFRIVALFDSELYLVFGTVGFY